MLSACSDAHLSLDSQTVRREFYSDLRCLVENHLPEFKRAISPHQQAKSATFQELQHCICLLLFHVASKAQAIAYRSGLQTCNSCFKHFLYVCRHVDAISPLSSMRIINGIEHCLNSMIHSFDPNDDHTLFDLMNNQPLEQATKALNQTVSDIIKQRISISS